MQPRIVRRVKARLAGERLRLNLFSVMDQHARANCAAVGNGANKFDFQPVMRTSNIVAKERGRLVQVDDQDVEIAVVVKIAERASAAAVNIRERGPGLFAEFLERPVSQISK